MIKTAIDEGHQVFTVGIPELKLIMIIFMNVWEGGVKTFINKGKNGCWRDVLSDADSARYEELALEKLGPECALVGCW